MRALFQLLNVRSMILIKGLTDRRWHTMSKNISSVVIFGSVAVGTFVLIRIFTAYIVHQVHVDALTLHQCMSFVLFSFFLAVNMVSLLVSYATLYTADDVPFLLGLPVSHTAVFGVRMVENIITSGATLTLLGMAGVLAYGSVFHLGFWHYLLIMFGVFLPFVLIAGMVAVMTLTGLILLAGRIGARWMIALAILAYIGGTYFLLQRMDPFLMVQSAMSSQFQSAAYAGGLDVAAVVWLPSEWVARAMSAMVQQRPAEVWMYVLFLTGLLALLTLAAVFVGRKWYYASWLAATEMRMRRSAPAGWFRLRIMEFGRFWGYRPHLEAILKRDFWMFFRDPMQRVHSLMMIALVCAVVFSIRSLDVAVTRPVSQVLSFVTVFIFVGFVVSSIILRFVFPAVSLEGDTFWAVRTAPITLSRLYWLKFIIALVLVLVPAEAMILATLPALRVPASLHGLAAAGMAGVVIALVSLNLGSGAYYATLKEKNPVKVASSQGASVTFLASLLILLVVAGILALPVAVTTGVLRQRAPYVVMSVAVGGIMVIACAVTILSHRLGLRSLRKDF